MRSVAFATFPPWTAAAFHRRSRRASERRFPLKSYRFYIGMLTVVFLVALRLTIGWHFLYEGVWKIENADKFSATPFLSMAKGPAAPMFYAMLPDLDGRKRLGSRPVASGRPLVVAWDEIRENVVQTYGLEGPAAELAHEMFWDHQEDLENYLRKQNQSIISFFDQRLGSEPPPEEAPAEQAAPEELRTWLAGMDRIEQSYLGNLAELAASQTKSGEISDPSVFRGLVPGEGEKLVLDDIVRGATIRNPSGDLLVVVVRAIPGWEYTTAWNRLKNDVIRKYKPGPDQRFDVKRIYQRYKDSAEEYLTVNQEFIEAHFASVDRFRSERRSDNVGASFQKKRIWDRQQELRGEVDEWLSELDGMGEAYRLAVWNVLEEDQKERGMIAEPVAAPNRLPLSLFGIRSQTQFLDVAVTYGLTAIGLCLLVGFCTRLAAIGGALFLVSVLLTQPPWPTIYPPAPEVVGHALIVDKNFVEMMALFLLATTAVGRWGGLDFFVYHWLGKPLLSRFRREGGEPKTKAAPARSA